MERCGKTYFGVDFETLSKKFDRDITQEENRKRLWNFTFQLDDLEHRIEELRNSHKGADWVHRNTRPLLTPNMGCPEEIIRRISSMIKTRTNVLFTQREATQTEIENREAIENRKLPRPYYVDEPLAEVAGIQAIYPENDLRTLLILDIEEKVKTFREKDIDALDYEELRHWVKWVDSVEMTMDRANQIILEGRRLLDAKNLKPFLKVLSITADKDLFGTYLRGLDKT